MWDPPITTSALSASSVPPREPTSHGHLDMNENEIGSTIVTAAIQIHRKLGPGLLESVYEAILARRLHRNGLKVKRQLYLPIEFDGLRFEEGFRADLIVEDKVIIELKCVEAVTNAHRKQLLTYLCLSNIRLGYLLNFNESLMKRGVYRIVNGLKG